MPVYMCKSLIIVKRQVCTGTHELGLSKLVTLSKIPETAVRDYQTESD